MNENDTRNILYLGPGGINTFLELGFVLALEQYKILEGFNVISGASIGSILAFLISLNLDLYTILAFCLEINIEDFMFNVDSLKTKTFFKMDLIKYKLVSMSEQIVGSIPTFESLYMFSGRDFRIPIYNMTKKRMEIFSKDNTPHLSCVDALMMSFSIPILFPNFTHNEDVYIDPFIVNPYPMFFFDNNKDQVLGVSVDVFGCNEDDSFSIIMDILFLCPNEISKLMKERCSEKCRHVVLNNAHKGLDYLSDKDNVANLLISGYRQGLCFVQSNYSSSIIEKNLKDSKSILKKIEIEDETFYENSYVNEEPKIVHQKKKLGKNIIIPMTPRIRDMFLDKNKVL